MNFRTDLALDASENISGEIKGIEKQEKTLGDVKSTIISVLDEEASQKLQKPKGKYITLEFPDIEKINDFSNLKTLFKSSMEELLPGIRDNIMIVGLGNTEITPDSVGPFAVNKVLATRHIAGQFAEQIGLKGLKSVSVITPGVLGKTGIETLEIVCGAAERVKPSAVIIIDALASQSVTRLFRTIQLSNTGISPGSGVKNSRKELNENTLGVPAIAVGVPTVVDAQVLAYELSGKEPQMNSDMIVTPKDADLLSHHMSEILAEALNVFLQPDIDEDIILSLV